MPHIVESRIDDQGVKARRSLLSKYRVFQIAIEFQSHGQFVRFPAVWTAASHNLDRSIGLETRNFIGKIHIGMGIDPFHGNRFFDTLPGNVDTPIAKHVLKIHHDGKGGESVEISDLRANLRVGMLCDFGVHGPVGSSMSPSHALDIRCPLAILSQDVLRENIGLGIDVGGFHVFLHGHHPQRRRGSNLQLQFRGAFGTCRLKGNTVSCAR